jgi:hypothetical protein
MPREQRPEEEQQKRTSAEHDESACPPRPAAPLVSLHPEAQQIRQPLVGLGEVVEQPRMLPHGKGGEARDVLRLLPYPWPRWVWGTSLTVSVFPQARRNKRTQVSFSLPHWDYDGSGAGKAMPGDFL